MAGFLSTMTALNRNEHNVFLQVPFLCFFFGLWGSISFLFSWYGRTFFVPMYLGRCKEPN